MGMTLKEYVNQVGKNSGGYAWTPLMAAFSGGHTEIIDYLFGILSDGVTMNATILTELYKKTFPNGTPIVCACEKGRFEDVKLLITGYNDVNGSNGNNNNMTLKEYVNQVGLASNGYDGYTPLDRAAENEHFQIVKY